jgi:hypothetical protein
MTADRKIASCPIIDSSTSHVLHGLTLLRKTVKSQIRQERARNLKNRKSEAKAKFFSC